jgi:hypothetical protein
MNGCQPFCGKEIGVLKHLKVFGIPALNEISFVRRSAMMIHITRACDKVKMIWVADTKRAHCLKGSSCYWM